ncbi:type III secretion system YscQ/HrcQ family protein [Natronocella acetinitrilica]|uniref:Type III secretion system YscQ/HrcQ family protein n=1 Tax=Natronocella acetinitrilica TaxID=414046 RepID=A0AAE3G3V6_9GAMM|nr:type III secretion system cytoplasmic ring protein SctQ [Natronocella acetinitrilica]MCP1675315.1 type III secretion system YscQ/HrcQ family protein [Natronocella acetinitrilica]
MDIETGFSWIGLAERLAILDRIDDWLPMQARLASILALRLPIQTGVLGRNLRLAFEPHPVGDDDVWHGSATLVGDGGAAEILFTRRALHALDPQCVTPDVFASLSPALRTGALLAALDTVLDCLEKATGHGFTLRDVTIHRWPQDPGPLQVTLRDEVGENLGALAIRTTPAGIGMLERLIGALPRMTRHHFRDLPLVLWTGLVPMAVTADELRSLRTGDVVRPGISKESGNFTVHMGRRRIGTASARRNSNVQMETLNMSQAPEGPTTEADQADTFRPEDVEIELRFDVGRINTTLATLQQLQPGYVFRVHDSGTQRISIRANGALIGRGELVAIGDELGIRLLELFDGSRRDGH